MNLHSCDLYKRQIKLPTSFFSSLILSLAALPRIPSSNANSVKYSTSAREPNDIDKKRRNSLLLLRL